MESKKPLESNFQGQNSNSCTSLDTKALKSQPEQTSGYRVNLIREQPAEYFAAFRFYENFCGIGKFTKFKLFLQCKTNVFFARQKSSGRISLVANSCHQRWCPWCSRSKTNTIRRNVREWLKDKKFPKFLTFTLQHTPTRLDEQIDILYESFKQLRRLKMFKKATSSGVWFFQIVKSKTDGNWHPHLHVITYGNYIPHRELSREWQRITGHSFVVDIRAIKDADKASDYVARYASKTCNILKFSDDELNEIHDAISKHRVCGSWGTAKKAKLTLPPKMNRNDWQILGRFSTIIGLYKIDARAKRIYNAYKSGQTLDDGVDVCDFDKIRKGEPPPPDSNFEVIYE
jgi:hypothetical protein